MHDFYVNFRVERKEDVNNLTSGLGKYTEIKDVLSRVMLLSTAYGVREKFLDRKGKPKLKPDVYAKIGEREPTGLKALIHSKKNYNNHLDCKLSMLNLVGVNEVIDVKVLPTGGWVLEFLITLEKAFISQDDVPFYIIDNPVKKEKVFGVPITSSTTWKGNLRWTMMKVLLEPKKNNAEEFAEVRFRHTLLFGTEKGWGENPSAWTNYLDIICPGAKKKYRDMLEDFAGKNKEIPHFQGMLYFYPTFWNKIDMMVINPHDRKTKTGRNPIYFEIVPPGAKGFFRLVYVPIHWIGGKEEELKRELLEDLRQVVVGVKEMMLTYGFSAKRTLGYGKIKDHWNKNESRLEIKEFLSPQKFGNFEELENIIKELQK